MSTRSLKSGGADALAGEVVLLLRDRDRGHSAAELAGRVERKAAPPGTDLQDVLPAGQSGTLRDEPVLVALGIGQRLVRRREDGTRVGHRLVQEEPVEVVAQIVVRGDVALALAPRVAPQPMGDGPPELERARATSQPTAPVPRGSAQPPAGARPGPGSTTGHPCRPRRHRSHHRPASARAPRCRGCGSRPARPTTGRRRPRGTHRAGRRSDSRRASGQPRPVPPARPPWQGSCP